MSSQPTTSPVRPYTLVWLLVLFVVAQIVISWLQYQEAEDELQGVVYSITEFGDYNDSFCPGDTIYISNTARHLKAPEIFMIVDTIWSVDQRFTVVRDDEPEYIVVTEEAAPETSTSLTLPQLDPGRYEFRHAAACEGCDVAYYTVKFTIRQECDQ